MPIPHDAPRAFDEIPQTLRRVGSVAEKMLSFYLERAGYSRGSRGTNNCLGFPDYWAQRKDRDHLAERITVQLDRATQGDVADSSDREKPFAALRSQLNAIEGEDRLWYSLFVGANTEGGDRVFSEAELLAAGKALGPDRLMLMLANRAPASDPDLVPKPWPSGCGHSEVGEAMRYFVLDHATVLLRSADAKDLLESPKARYAHWAIAAAALRPDLAEDILKNAIAKLGDEPFGWDQARMAAAPPRIAGASHPHALDWFYGRSPSRTSTTAQEMFITQVDRSDPRGVRCCAPCARSATDAIPEPALKSLTFESTAGSQPLVEGLTPTWPMTRRRRPLLNGVRPFATASRAGNNSPH
jgi:hypothetical protein